jgi:transcriptional regulator with XRE-family HTH domain
VKSIDPLIAFGQRLRQFRENVGLSQEKLAEMAELHRNYVGSLERGQSNVSLLAMVRLARCLKVKPYELIDAVR